MLDAQVVEPRTNSLPVPTHAAPLSGSSRRLWKSAVAPLVALLLLAPSICWILQDRSVWPWDQAYYGEVTVDLYYTLRTNPAAWPAAMLHAIPSKPPGLTWLGQFFVPLGKKIGSIDHTLLLAILLLQFITLLLIYRIGRALSPSRGTLAGLVGCTLLGAAPLFVGLSHQYMIEPLQTLAVTWFFYCAIMSPRWGRLRILSNLIAATAVAMLAKTTSPVYCLLPGLMATSQLLRRRPSEPASYAALGTRLVVLALASGLLACTVVWYQANWQSVYTHAYECSLGELGLPHGHKVVFLRKLAFWFTALREGMFTPPLFWMGVFLVLLGGVACVSGFRRKEEEQRPWAADCLALLAGLQAALVLVLISLSIPESSRYITAALPAVAVVLMWAVARVPLRGAGVVFATAVLLQWGYVHSITLGLTDGKAACDWLIPVEKDAGQDWEVAEACRLTSQAVDHYNVVGIELPWCNCNTFAYYTAKNRLFFGQRAYYSSLGYAEKDIDKALGQIDAVNAAYFISVEEGHQPKPANFLNLVTAPVLARVREDDRYERLPFPSEFGLIVFKRKPPEVGRMARPRAGARAKPHDSEMKESR